MFFKFAGKVMVSFAGFMLILTSFLTACISGNPQGLLTPSRDDNYYDQRNSEDRDRSSALDRSRRRYSGSACENDRECEDMCKDIYNRRSVREDCLTLALEQVEKLWEIYEIFENPKEDDLENIDPDDFEIFVEIDLRPLDTLIGKFGTSDAKKVLTWMLEEPDIVEIFQDEDDDFDLLKELLKALNSTSGSQQYQQALAKNIDGGDSFIEIAASDEGAALDWIHGFFSEQCDSDSKGEEVCIFKDWYCAVSLNNDSWDSLVGYEDFAEIVDEILSEYTVDSPPPWWTEDTEARDLSTTGSDNQLEWLCNQQPNFIERTN